MSDEVSFPSITQDLTNNPAAQQAVLKAALALFPAEKQLSFKIFVVIGHDFKGKSHAWGYYSIADFRQNFPEHPYKQRILDAAEQHQGLCMTAVFTSLKDVVVQTLSLRAAAGK